MKFAVVAKVALASIILLVSGIFAVAASSAPFDPSATAVDPVFSGRPYSLDLREIAALDPKPLRMAAFSPDADSRVQGVRIVSQGRIFPFIYEVVTFPAVSSVDSTLETIRTSLSDHADIILLETGNPNCPGNCLHFFQRTSVNGKPHHVSSNYIFVHDGTVYHLLATSYAATIMPRDNWGEPKPDLNADREALLLLRSLRSN